MKIILLVLLILYSNNLFSQELIRTLSGHNDYVYSVSYSPDGNILASGSSDKTIKLWNRSDGSLIRTLSGHNKGVNSVSFSPDGKILASGSSDKTIKLWNISDGSLIRTLYGHNDYVYSVSFSPDGKILASGSMDKTIKLWDVHKGSFIRTLSRHNNKVHPVSFSPDGKILASGSWDKTIILWNVSNGSLIRTLSGHNDRVQSVSFSPNGNILASGSMDKTIKLWNVSDGSLIRTLPGHNMSVRSVSFKPNGNILASGSSDKTIKLWNVSDGSLIHTLLGHNDKVRSVSFSPEGDILASGSLDKTIKLWDLAVLNIDPSLVIEFKSKLRYLFKPKDEFETSSEYKARMENAKFQKERLIEEYIQKSVIVRSEREKDKNEKIHESISEVIDLKIESVGKYNADKEELPITIKGITKIIFMPRNEAKSFKENWINTEVIAWEQLTPDLENYEYFNIQIVHPVSGKNYNFGEQRESDPLILQSGKNVKSIIPPSLKINVAFNDENGNGFLEGSESGKLICEISNEGSGSAYSVKLNMGIESEDNSLTFIKERSISEIKPQEKKKVTFEINANRNAVRKKHTFILSGKEINGFNPDPVKISLETYPLLLADLSLIDYGVMSSSGSNIISPGELADITARIRNIGEGIARDVELQINIPKNVFFGPESKQRFSLGELQPGDFKDITFSILTNKEVEKQIEIGLIFVEKYTNGHLPLKLDIDKPLQNIQEFIVKGELLQKELPQGNIPMLSIDVEKDIPTISGTNENAIAIILGVEKYRSIQNVPFAKRDAYWFKEYAVKLFGVPENKNNLYFKTDAEVTRGELEKLFSENGWLSRRVNKNSDIYIYYAGHGGPDIKNKTPYLIPYDGDPNYPTQTGFPVNRLYEELAKLDVNSITVFIDACFSGGTRENKMIFADARPVHITVENPAVLSEVLTVFTASSGDQISSSYPEKKHGLFTYYLLKGLKGEGDLNYDNQITVQEMETYLQTNVSRTAGMLDREQTPQVIGVDKTKVLVEF